MNSVTGFSTESWIDKALEAATGMRMRVLEHCLKNDGGYLSQACSSAEILATLYLKTMRLGPSIAPLVPPPFPGVPGTPGVAYVNGAGYNGPVGPAYDRFFLSPAHYALVLYTALIETGRMSPEGLAQFNKDGSSVEMIGAEHSPGFEAMGGALAQTLSQAAGLALARQRSGDKGKVFVFMSDGEFQEGQTWEAIQTMTFFGIGNLIAYVDVNGQQCDGPTKEVMGVEPLDAKIRAFGGTATIVDGHDPAALDAAAREGNPEHPHFVLCKTDPARGVELLERRKPKLHYLRFTSAEEKADYEAFFAGRGRSKPGAKARG
ncbi:MAG: transketolase [Spirochaetales bacterium]